MKIYVGHSRQFDFQNELYKPLKEMGEELNLKFIFPHDDREYNNSREVTRVCDLMIAEISFRSTGLGIEMGWVNDLDKPIICLHKTGTKISESVKTITDKFIEYGNEKELKDGVGKMLELIQREKE